MIRRLLYLILMCFLPMAIFAQTQTEQKIIQKVSDAAKNMKSMQCNFTQTKHLKMLNDKMVSKGKMYYQQPNKLHWEYTSPYAFSFILNDSKVYLKKGTQNNVIDVNQNKMFKEIARMMMNSIVGKCLTDTKSFKTSIADSKGEYLATLIPQKSEVKQMFSKIILHFSKKTNLVTKVEMHEKEGDSMVIELTSVKTNAKVDAKVFNE